MAIWLVVLPSGYVNSLLLKMAIEIVSFPKKKVIFHSYVSLPEGIWLVVLTCFNHETHSSMGRNGKNYPIYHGKYTYPSEK